MDDIGWGMAVGLAVYTYVVFRIGMAIGRLRSESAAIQPIDPARISPTVQAQVNNLLRENRKIDAIKLLREETGCGLAEAKKTIDAIPTARLDRR